jgi:hypothetical protein
MKKLLDILLYPYTWFALSAVILGLNAIRKNNNFFDIRSVFIQQFKLFNNCKGQIIVFYLVPFFLTLGTVFTKSIDKDIINNIIIVLSIFMSMLFAVLSILCSFRSENPKYIITLKETFNTVIYENILCIFVLIISFVQLFIDDYNGGLKLIVTSGLIYYLMFTIVLHIFIIMKRMKALFDFMEIK